MQVLLFYTHASDGHLFFPPLFQGARRRHAEVVDMLRQAGANFGGSDVDGGYVRLEVGKAQQTADEASLDVWRRAGIDTDSFL